MEINHHNQKLESKIVELELEYASAKDKCEYQARSLVEKSSVISKLEAASMQQTSTILDLKHELQSAKERIEILESDRRNLENESLSINDRNTQLIKSLEKQLESLSNEHKLQQDEFSKKYQSLDEDRNKQTEKLKTEYNIEKQALINSYEAKLNTEKAAYEEKLLTVERVCFFFRNNKLKIFKLFFFYFE